MAKRKKATRLKLIVNPNAGEPEQTKDKLEQARHLLEELGFEVDVAKARPKGKASATARKAVKEGFKTIVAMGGDGMAEAVMRGMAGSKAKLGILPTGIENNIARSLGIPLDLEQACRLAASEQVRELDVREVKTSGGKWYPFFEVMGMGYYLPLIPDGNSTAGEELSMPPMAARMPAHDKQTPKVTFSLDGGKDMEVETPLVMVSNSCVFGEKYQVLHAESAPEDELDVSIFEGYSKDDLRRYYAGMKDGAYPFNGTVQRYQACKMKVDSSPRMKVMADGVDLGRAPALLRVRQGAIRLIAAGEGVEFVSKNREAYEAEAVEDESRKAGGEDPYGFEG